MHTFHCVKRKPNTIVLTIDHQLNGVDLVRMGFMLTLTVLYFVSLDFEKKNWNRKKMERMNKQINFPLKNCICYKLNRMFSSITKTLNLSCKKKHWEYAFGCCYITQWFLWYFCWVQQLWEVFMQMLLNLSHAHTHKPNAPGKLCLKSWFWWHHHFYTNWIQ